MSAQQQQAFASATKVLVDSKEVSFDAYIINDFTYFKLRDVAMALNGTQKNSLIHSGMKQKKQSMLSQILPIL